MALPLTEKETFLPTVEAMSVRAWYETRERAKRGHLKRIKEGSLERKLMMVSRASEGRLSKKG